MKGYSDSSWRSVRNKREIFRPPWSLHAVISRQKHRMECCGLHVLYLIWTACPEQWDICLNSIGWEHTAECLLSSACLPKQLWTWNWVRQSYMNHPEWNITSTAFEGVLVLTCFITRSFVQVYSGGLKLASIYWERALKGYCWATTELFCLSGEFLL